MCHIQSRLLWSDNVNKDMIFLINKNYCINFDNWFPGGISNKTPYISLYTLYVHLFLYFCLPISILCSPISNIFLHRHISLLTPNSTSLVDIPVTILPPVSNSKKYPKLWHPDVSSTPLPYHLYIASCTILHFSN